MHHHILRRVAASTTLALGVLVAALPATALPATALPTTPVPATTLPTDVILSDLDLCTGDQDVTVVVDFTDLGGEIETGCATAGTTGTEALVEAGFTDARDEFTMICAIDGLPDPCPAEFTGSFWSYWYGADGAWQTYLEGSDTAVTTAGGIEGWRYADGTLTPQVAVPGSAEGTADATEEPAAPEVTPEETVQATPINATVEADGLSTAAVAGIGLAAALVAAAVILGLRRRHADLAGPDPADPTDPSHPTDD